MRLWMAAIVLGAAALPLTACDRDADAEKAPKVVETPKRQPGLWKQTTTVAGVGAVPAVSICLDEAADKKLAWWAQQGVRGGCTRNDVTKNADGSWSFASVCESPGGTKTVSEGKATGDFQSSYKVTALSTTTGAINPQMNGAHNVTIESTWAGACPSNMRPGDMQLPDGNLVNLIDITGQ